MPTNDLQSQVNQLKYRAAELERKTQGITLANRRAAQLETQVSTLAGRVDLFVEAGAGEAQLRAFGAEATRLERAINAGFDDLQGQIDTLSRRVDGVEAGQGALIDEVAAHARAFAEIRRIVSSLHPIAWVLAAVAGILFGGIWAAQDWNQHAVINGVPVTVDNTAANSWWVATIIGVAAGLFVLFVLSFFLRVDNEEIAAAADAEAMARIAGGRQTAPPASPQPPADDNGQAGTSAQTSETPSGASSSAPTSRTPRPSTDPPTERLPVQRHEVTAAAGATARVQ